MPIAMVAVPRTEQERQHDDRPGRADLTGHDGGDPDRARAFDDLPLFPIGMADGAGDLGLAQNLITRVALQMKAVETRADRIAVRANTGPLNRGVRNRDLHPVDQAARRVAHDDEGALGTARRRGVQSNGRVVEPDDS